MAITLRAVVKLSVQGTLLSVHLISIHAMNTQHRTKTTVKGKYFLNGMRVIGISFSSCCASCFFRPLLQTIQP